MMKKLRYNIYYGIVLVTIFLVSSCDLMEINPAETPKDFLSTDIAYESKGDFDRALNGLYAKVRDIHFEGASDVRHAHMYGTDIIKNARGDNGSRFGDYNVFLVPTGGWPTFHWDNWYKVVSNTNTILSRVDDSGMTDSEKTLISAEAKFFRAFAYRYLVHLFGGVPLIVEEIKEPRTDLTRASKEAVLNQIVEDATEASSNLPSIDSVQDGKVSNLVAYHLLAETYISLGEYDAAISAATNVIDDPNTSLMTERFGTRANEDPEDEFLKFETSGDVYWDLFRQGNQDRSAGNNEALWVAQMEVNVDGGLLTTTGWENALERLAGPVHWITFQDPDGNEGMVGERSNYNAGGRGVSFMMNTDFFLNDLWESDWDNDIRNAPHNIIRDVVYDNPESAWYDSSAVKYPSPTDINQDWRWYPFPSKITTPGNHPDEVFLDKDRNLLSTAAGSTYRERYYLRLAETYLLRAEAYLGNNDPINAASDINMVRERSNATPVAPGDVTIDYILDERARELVYEEQRRITLHRTGKLVERVRMYNDLNADDIEDFHDLWPIPASEIEANKDATLEQNPQY